MAKITTHGRKRMKASTFAIPSKRAYPIPDLKHARLALAMASRSGSTRVKAQVRRAVHRKFPSIHVSGLRK